MSSKRNRKHGREEVFILKRKDVQATYAYNEDILKYDPTHKGALLLREYLLRTFGDGCLPDKPAEEKQSESKRKNEQTISLSELEQIVNEIEIKDYPPYLDRPRKIVETNKNMEEKEIDRQALCKALLELSTVSFKVYQHLKSLQL